MRLFGSFSALALSVFFGVSSARAQLPSKQITDREPWIHFPLPAKVIVQKLAAGGLAEKVVQQTTAGLAARHARLSPRAEPYVWIKSSRGQDEETFFELWQKRTRVPVENFDGDIWALVKLLKDMGAVKGYVLYRADSSPDKPYGEIKPADLSLNVATSVCGPLQAIAVDESLEPAAKALGLPLLADCRGKDYAWVLQKIGRQYSTQLLALLDPRSPTGRDLAVASDALAVLNVPGGGFEEALRLIEPGGTVFGWGITPEDHFVQTTSAAGLNMVPANWTANLPVLSSAPEPLGPATITVAAPRLPENGKRYVAFVISDGDNLTWFTGGYTSSKKGFGNSARGTIPFGWTVPLATFAEVTPDAWSNLIAHAMPNDEYLQLGLRGYNFIDLTPLDILAKNVRRLSQDLAGTKTTILDVFTHKEWNSPASRAAFATIAQNCPSLQGILATQYNPYSEGQGAMFLVSRDDKKIPVLSPLYAIWKRAKDNQYLGSPESAAAAVNAWAHRPLHKPSDQFSWVAIHAWSNFGGDIQGIGAAVAAAKLFDPAIEVVKPSEMMSMLYKKVNNP